MEMLTARQYAKKTGFPEGTIRRMIKDRQVPGFYSGNRYLIDADAFTAKLHEMSAVNAEAEPEAEKHKPTPRGTSGTLERIKGNLFTRYAASDTSDYREMIARAGTRTELREIIEDAGWMEEFETWNTTQDPAKDLVWESPRWDLKITRRRE